MNTYFIKIHIIEHIVSYSSRVCGCERLKNTFSYNALLDKTSINVQTSSFQYDLHFRLPLNSIIIRVCLHKLCKRYSNNAG